VRNHSIAIIADVMAIVVVAGLYFHRHQRRDLLLAYVALNAGLVAVTTSLTSTSVGAGLGLGLFGILSIIRLRSDGITQEEIAYYFIALALALVAGVNPGPVYVTPLLCFLMVAVMYVADHPRLFRGARRQLVTLDAAIPQEAAVRAYLEQRLGVEVRHLIVQEVDFVRDLTIVDVRFRTTGPLIDTSRLARVTGARGLGVDDAARMWQPGLPDLDRVNDHNHNGVHATSMGSPRGGQEAPGS
jgi:hypothetical protein